MVTVIAFHARRARPVPPAPEPGAYRPDILQVLFGTAL